MTMVLWKGRFASHVLYVLLRSNQQTTMELISARKTSHKDNSTLTLYASKYKVNKLYQRHTLKPHSRKDRFTSYLFLFACFLLSLSFLWLLLLLFACLFVLFLMLLSLILVFPCFVFTLATEGQKDINTQAGA